MQLKCPIFPRWKLFRGSDIRKPLCCSQWLCTNQLICWRNNIMNSFYCSMYCFLFLILCKSEFLLQRRSLSCLFVVTSHPALLSLYHICSIALWLQSSGYMYVWTRKLLCFSVASYSRSYVHCWLHSELESRRILWNASKYLELSIF